MCMLKEMTEIRGHGGEMQSVRKVACCTLE